MAGHARRLVLQMAEVAVARDLFGQTPPTSGPTTRCAGFWSSAREALQRTADRSANAGAPSSIWGIPVYATEFHLLNVTALCVLPGSPNMREARA